MQCLLIDVHCTTLPLNLTLIKTETSQVDCHKVTMVTCYCHSCVATERILGRLSHHEPGKELPVLQPLKALVPDISTAILDEKAATLHLLKSDLNNLKEYAK